MFRSLKGLLLLAMFALGLQVQAGLPVRVEGQELPTLAPMLERTTPAVVNISTRGTVMVQERSLLSDPFFQRFFKSPDAKREKETKNLGSGVIVDAGRGVILTNHHVIETASQITVTLRDGRRLSARLVGSDPETDVAVIQVEANELVALPFGDSERLRVGDFVVAIGNPFGLGQTVTSGIVSALGRSGLGIEGYEDFIQTDASINPGNSGGALVNLRGELIGINTAIYAPGGGNVGIGFAIPAAMVREIMAQLVEHGEINRGRLGVSVQDLTPELAEAFDLPARQGGVVVQVLKDSPADQAGLRTSDIIVALNGKAVRGSADLRNRVGLLRVGETLHIDILRAGQPVRLKAVVGEIKRALLEGGSVHARLEGATFSTLSGDEGSSAVNVAEVARNSVAWETGLRVDDVITGVNRKQVKDLAEFAARVKQHSRALMLNLVRGNSNVFLLIH